MEVDDERLFSVRLWPLVQPQPGPDGTHYHLTQYTSWLSPSNSPGASAQDVPRYTVTDPRPTGPPSVGPGLLVDTAPGADGIKTPPGSRPRLGSQWATATASRSHVKVHISSQ